MTLVREKLYRDPVHDLIALDKNNRDDRTLMALIDSAEVQRLRRIRQLGLANVAYPGAEHSRFTHSLGVMWTATRVLRQLERATTIPASQAFAVRCAALLHDVGHGPLSHVFEKFTHINHELWTRRIIRHKGSEVNRILSEHHENLPREVEAIMDGRSHPPFLSQVISSQLDADRFDYLLRDSHMTGAKYGVFDFERLIKMLRLDATGHNIVVSHAGIHPVEGYLQSRFHMYAQVYLHKTVRAAEALLGLLLKRAADLAAAGKLDRNTDDPMIRLLTAAGKRQKAKAAPNTTTEPYDLSLEDYLEIDDHSVYGAMKRWRHHDDKILADLCGRVVGRKVFKTIDVSRTKGLTGRLKRARSYLQKIGADPSYYLYLDESGDVPYRPYDQRSRRAGKQILVAPPEGVAGPCRDIVEVSEVIAGLARAAFITKRVMFPAALGEHDVRGEMHRIFRDDHVDESFLPSE